MNDLLTQKIESKIYFIRNQKVMLDGDLAELFEVKSKRLNEQVKRNIERFPNDFMFQLDRKEFENLRSQIATSSSQHGGRRYEPFAFTESGIAMLSSVLNSKEAIQVNIWIMRTFVKLRKLIPNDEDSAQSKIKAVEKGSNKLFKIVFERLEVLEKDRERFPLKRKKIGLKG